MPQYSHMTKNAGQESGKVLCEVKVQMSKCFSVVSRDIHGEFLHHLHPESGDGVKSSHIHNKSLLASFYMSKLLN